MKKVNSAGIISNFAGSGAIGFYGDGGPAVAAEFSLPNRLAISTNGDVYINDYGNYRIRKVDVSGTISTFAGTGSAAHGADGGKAWDTPMQPYGMASDANGNIYIADYGPCIIRLISPDDNVSTVAGNRECGYNGDCQDPRSAKLNGPDAIAVADDGTIYIADRDNYRVRAVGDVCHNLAVENAEDKGNPIAVYPDPATIMLHVSAPFRIDKVSIINYIGQTVYSGKQAATIDVSDLPAGVYLVKINDLNIKRFLKQ